MSDREIGVEQARKQLGPIVNDAAVDGTVTYLTLHGRRYAALVPLAEIETLAAFREVAGWSDEQVQHMRSCLDCVPICGHEEYDCEASPATIQLKAALRQQRADREPSALNVPDDHE